MITLLAFSKFIKVMTAMSITMCLQIDDNRHLNYCVNEVMECVLDGEAIEFCGGLYIEENETWNK
jgi:hypothetical protein